MGRDRRRPVNVLFISVDTLCADHLGCYGYDRPTSPFIDGLAAEGVRFENAFAQASWTLPSHMSMMTSLYPHTHQVETDKRTLPKGAATLAQILKKAGYSTTAFVTHAFLSNAYQFARGFDFVEDIHPQVDAKGRKLTSATKADRFVDRVAVWIREQPRRPFLLFLHLFDPHYDYQPPAEFATMFDPDYRDNAPGRYGALRRYIRQVSKKAVSIPADYVRKVLALYDAEIRFTDTHLKRLFGLLEEAGLLEDTLVVFTSDHGEEFGEHGSMEGHQWTLYDEVLHVPLILRFPDGAFGGAEREAIVQLIDIAPTVLDALGMDVPDAFEGRSLIPLIERGDQSRRGPQYTFSQLKRFNKKWAVRSRRFKLIFTEDTTVNRFGVPITPGFELYDLANDPGERNNIFEPQSGPAQLLGPVLRSWRVDKKPMAQVDTPTLTSEQIQQLKELGYME